MNNINTQIKRLKSDEEINYTGKNVGNTQFTGCTRGYNGTSKVLHAVAAKCEHNQIRFAIESPLKVIPINVIGSALASSLAVLFGTNNTAPISGFYGWFTVEKWPLYVLSIFIGAFFIAFANILLRKPVVESVNTIETAN